MIETICKNAKHASRKLALTATAKKNRVLAGLSEWLVKNQEAIIRENQIDVAEGRTAGLPDAMIDRLTLTPERIRGMADDVEKVARLPDPTGEIIEESDLENGLHYQKKRVPLGVLAVIYESRPNVTIDVAVLAIKSGNAIILRGGKETIRSNRILVEGIHAALLAEEMDAEIVQFINDPDRALVDELLGMYMYVDMLIPRGGAGLHRFCREHSTIPVITGGIGICHLFVDESADQEMSVELIRNAKIQRPTVCNALDTALVHARIADVFIPRLVERLRADGVGFRLNPLAMETLGDVDRKDTLPAGDDDFDTEWLSLILGIKVVDGLEEAIAHIAAHSTGHSDGILTMDLGHAEEFTNRVDSAVVYVNASTRFTDGAQLGLGAEVAISTQRLHARGPMALRELTTYKWVVSGDYHIRE